MELSTIADVRTPASRVYTATVRAWARDNGWPELGDRGRVPAEATAAFEAAHGEPVDVEDDVSAIDDDEDLYDWDGADPSGQPAGDEPAFAPPADLDEARERVGRVPGSAHLNRGRKRGSKREPKQPSQPAPKVTPAVRRDIEGKVAFWLLIPGEPWRRVDPYCGQAYLDSIEDIALKATPLLCQSPAVVRWFAKSTTFVQVTELAMACRPVAEAIIAHHVTRRITLDSLGRPVVVEGGGVDFGPYSARQPNPAAA
jgi:hypothetical protein